MSGLTRAFGETVLSNGIVTRSMDELYGAGVRFEVVHANPAWGPPGQDARRLAHCLSELKPPVSKHAALFLWARWDGLYARPGPLDVIESWGFRYVGRAFVWVQMLNSSNLSRPVAGDGQYVRDSDGGRVCLLGVRGRLAVADPAVHSAILQPIPESGGLPEQVYESVEYMFPGLDYLTMFDQPRPYWVSYQPDALSSTYNPIDKES